MYHIGTQQLETPQVILRRIRMEDAEDMFRNWASDPDVTRYMTWHPHKDIGITKEIISNWIQELTQDACYKWCIEFRDNQQVIGTIDAVHIHEPIESCEIGYCLSKAYWGRGIMTEALSAVEDFFFSKVGFNRIEARHLTENPASGKVMLKSGMQFEGIKRQGVKDKYGKFCDLAIYAILKSDWLQQNRGKDLK